MWDVFQKLEEKVRINLESGIIVELPDINRSSKNTSIKEGHVLLGLSAVRGLSDDLIDAITSERMKGEYRDFRDLLVRVEDIYRNSDVIVNLIKCGSLDKLGLCREQMLGAVANQMLLKDLDRYWNEKKQTAYHFEIEEPDTVYDSELISSNFEKYLENSSNSVSQKSQKSMERESLLYSPYDVQIYPYQKAMRTMKINRQNLQELMTIDCKKHIVLWGRIRGIDCDVIGRGQGRGSLYIRALLEDSIDVVEIKFVMKKTAFKQSGIEEGALIQIEGSLNCDEKPFIYGDRVKILPSPKELIKTVSISIPSEEITWIKMHHLKSILDSNPGFDQVRLVTEIKERNYYANLPSKINSSNRSLRSYLFDIFDHFEMSIEPDGDLYGKA